MQGALISSLSKDVRRWYRASGTWILSGWPSGSDPASPGPRKTVPKVSFDSRSPMQLGNL